MAQPGEAPDKRPTSGLRYHWKHATVHLFPTSHLSLDRLPSMNNWQLYIYILLLLVLLLLVLLLYIIIFIYILLYIYIYIIADLQSFHSPKNIKSICGWLSPGSVHPHVPTEKTVQWNRWGLPSGELHQVPYSSDCPIINPKADLKFQGFQGYFLLCFIMYFAEHPTWTIHSQDVPSNLPPTALCTGKLAQLEGEKNWPWFHPKVTGNNGNCGKTLWIPMGFRQISGSPETPPPPRPAALRGPTPHWPSAVA